MSGRNAAQYAAGIVGQEDRLAVLADAHLVGIVLAGDFGSTKAVADLDALDGVDRHQVCGDILVELGVDRRADAGRHALGHHFDDGADR
ncbi:hypothetical protein D3C72_1837830 [compost metagenome]